MWQKDSLLVILENILQLHLRMHPVSYTHLNGGRNYNGPKVAKFLVG